MADWAPHVRARLASLRLSPTRENEIVDEHLDDTASLFIVALGAGAAACISGPDRTGAPAIGSRCDSECV